MGKTFEQLHEKLDGLYELKSQAEAAASTEERRRLRQQVFDGAMELLETSGESSPVITSRDKEGIEREQERWKKEIKWPAESLRDWFIKAR